MPFKSMTLKRINELRIELKAERISYGEIAEIDAAAEIAGIVIKEGMMAGDILDELESLDDPPEMAGEHPYGGAFTERPLTWDRIMGRDT